MAAHELLLSRIVVRISEKEKKKMIKILKLIFEDCFS